MNTNASKSLSGRTVVLTRALNQQGKAKKMLEDLGARVLDLPALTIGPPNDWAPLDNALKDLGSFDWIIFSSANGVRSVEQRLKKIGTRISKLPSGLQVAAVGEKTAQLLEKLGHIADFIPPDFIADSLIEHFPNTTPGVKVLIPRVESGGRTILSEAFKKAGLEVHEVAGYESFCPKEIPKQTLNAIKNASIDAIAFTSSKSVVHTVNLLRTYFGDTWNKKLQEVVLISIGPQTSLSLKKYFGRISDEAHPHDLEGLASSCINLLRK